MFHHMLPIGALALSLLSVQPTSASSEASPCIPLKDYVDPDFETNLDIFQSGGDIDSVSVVYFNIPRMQMSPPYLRAKLCIEDLPIPSSVGGRQCDGGEAQGWNNCWLIVATREGSNVNPDDTQHCESEDKNSGTASCYECLCEGSYFGAGSVPGGSQVSDTMVDSCGPRSPERWGASCDDVQNARRIPASDRVNLSNHSTVQINICPEASDGCSVCQGGGYHPAFDVGLQWSNDVEQCSGEPKYGAPFSAGHVQNGISFGSVAIIWISVAVILVMHCI